MDTIVHEVAAGVVDRDTSSHSVEIVVDELDALDVVDVVVAAVASNVCECFLYKLKWADTRFLILSVTDYIFIQHRAFIFITLTNKL